MNNPIANNPIHPLIPPNAQQWAPVEVQGEAQNPMVQAAAGLAQPLPAPAVALPNPWLAMLPPAPNAQALPAGEEEPVTPEGQGIPQAQPAPWAPFAPHEELEQPEPPFQGVNLMDAFNAATVDGPNTPNIKERR